MKFVEVSFVLVIHVTLISSVAIKRPHENHKQDDTNIDNVISLAEAVQKLQAMQLANDKHNKNKLSEKFLNEKVIAATTEIYQFDTTIIAQPERELIKNGHIAGRGEVLLNQIHDESLVNIPDSDVVTDQKLDVESETLTEISKNVGARNDVGVKKVNKFHNQHDIIPPGDKGENKGILTVKPKLHQHPAQLGPSSDTKESKRHHIVQNRKENYHLVSDKSKIAPSTTKHIIKSVMPHSKAGTGAHIASKSHLEMNDGNNLTNVDIHVHRNPAAVPSNTSSKVKHQKNSLKSTSVQHHKILSPSVSSHNPISHGTVSKIDKNNHETKSNKGSQPNISVIDTSKEDSLDPSQIDPTEEDTYMVDTSKDDTLMVDSSEEDTVMVDPSLEDTVMVDPSLEDTVMVDPSMEDTVRIDPSNEYTDLEDPVVSSTELSYHPKEDSELINSYKDNVNSKVSNQEEDILKIPLTVGKEPLTPSTGDVQVPEDTHSLKVDKDLDENIVSGNGVDNNLVKVNIPEEKGTEESNKKNDDVELKPLHNQSKHLQRKPFVKKPVHKYRPAKLTHKLKEEIPKNLGDHDINPEPKVTNTKSSEPVPHDISLQTPESGAPDPKLPTKIKPQKSDLKKTLPTDPKAKEKEVTAREEKAVNKNQDAKDVLTYLKHERQVIHKKKSTSSNYVIAVSLILIVSTILFSIVGVYYRQLRIDRQKYIGHMLLENEDDEDMQLFNRQTYHDDDNHGYESWNAIR